VNDQLALTFSDQDCPQYGLNPSDWAEIVRIQGAGGTLKTVCICSYVHVVGILMQDDVALVINARLHVQLLVKHACAALCMVHFFVE
jgi:hypothetical protein